MTRSARVPALAAAAALLLAAGCNRGDGNPNAPVSPGTGNPTEVTRPSAADTPPGGPSGIKGSLPHPGSSGGDAVPGTTGSGGGSAATASAPAPAPGTGTGGGLTGAFPASAPATPGSAGGVNQGSTNTTPAR